MAPILSTERWDSEAGHTTKLCRKLEVDSGEPATTNSPYAMQSTWDDPAIAGVVVRINWQASTPRRSARWNDRDDRS